MAYAIRYIRKDLENSSRNRATWPKGALKGGYDRESQRSGMFQHAVEVCDVQGNGGVCGRKGNSIVLHNTISINRSPTAEEPWAGRQYFDVL